MSRYETLVSIMKSASVGKSENLPSIFLSTPTHERPSLRQRDADYIAHHKFAEARRIDPEAFAGNDDTRNRCALSVRRVAAIIEAERRLAVIARAIGHHMEASGTARLSERVGVIVQQGGDILAPNA